MLYVATSCSANGDVVVGHLGNNHAGRWTEATGTQDIGSLASGYHSHATDVSADGAIVGGFANAPPPNSGNAIRWTQATGMVAIGDLPTGGHWSAVNAVSAGGTTLVGTGTIGLLSTDYERAFRYTAATGMVNLGTLPGGTQSTGSDVSADGAISTGVSESLIGYQAFRWTESTGLEALGRVRSDDAKPAVSANGDVIVGGNLWPTGAAWLWSRGLGFVELKSYLESKGLSLAGWDLRFATGVSADGTTICGWGINPIGQDEAWLVTIAPQNSSPIATSDDYQTDEDVELSITAPGVLMNDSDSDPGDTLTAHLVEGPLHALAFSLNADGSFSYTPTANFSGQDQFLYIARDDDGAESAATAVTIEVQPVNDPPQLGSIENRSVAESTALLINASASDPDLPADAFSFSLIDAPAGASIESSTGVFTWTPTESQGPGDYIFTIRVTDNGNPNLSDEETITVQVDEANVAPALQAIGNKTVDEGSGLTFTAIATDPDLPAQSLTFSLVGAPAGAAIHPTSGVFNWTPTEAQGPGAFTFKVRVTDSGTPSLFDEEEITVTVNEVNEPPILGAIGNRTVDEMTFISINATASDSDQPGQALTFSLGTAPSGASINPATGVITWTPSEADGPNPVTFEVIVSDGTATDTESFVVTVAEVNRPPVLTPPGDQTVAETVALSLQLAATDPDLPANGLTFEKVSGPAALTVSASGLVQWTPTDSDGPARVAVSVRVIDHGLPSLADTAVFYINVTDADIVEKSISGRVELLDFVGDLAQQSIAFEIRTVGEPGTMVFSRTVNLTSDGSYSFVTSLGSVGTGLYDIVAKGSHWLRRVRRNVSISASGAAGVDFTGSAALINGDVDGDNEVGIGDYAMLSFGYGSIPGDANWLANADVNGDLAVDIADYAILSARYGLVGDE